jgi:uncharacterized protein (TIGR02246 family)
MRTLLLLLFLLAAPQAALAQSDPDLAARVEILEAERDIERQLHEYGRAIDEGDFDAYVGLFAEDGEWIGGMGAFVGRDAIRAMLEANMRPGPRERLTSFHMMTSPLIDVAEDGRTATSVSRWTFFMAGEDGAPRAAMAGRYFDDWVKADGVWLIRRRTAPSDIPFDDLSGAPDASE